MDEKFSSVAIAASCAAVVGGIAGYALATRVTEKSSPKMGAPRVTSATPASPASINGYACLSDATPLAPRSPGIRPQPKPSPSRAAANIRSGSTSSVAEACARVAAASAMDVGMLHAPMTPEMHDAVPMPAAIPDLAIPAAASSAPLRGSASAGSAEADAMVAAAASSSSSGSGAARGAGGGRPVIIGVGGASGSGKTSMNRILSSCLPRLSVASISGDSYYIPLSEGQDAATYNFDTPKAIDFDLLAEHLRCLRRGEAVEVPQYDFATHSRLPDTTKVSNVHVIIVDGIFTLAVKSVRALCDFTVFTLEDLDVCLARRLKRDIAQRGRQVDDVLEQYERFVKPGYHSFVAPTMRYADLIVPRARENTTTLSMLVQYIRLKVIELQPGARHLVLKSRPVAKLESPKRLFDPDGM